MEVYQILPMYRYILNLDLGEYILGSTLYTKKVYAFYFICMIFHTFNIHNMKNIYIGFIFDIYNVYYRSFVYSLMYIHSILHITAPSKGLFLNPF